MKVRDEKEERRAHKEEKRALNEQKIKELKEMKVIYLILVH